MTQPAEGPEPLNERAYRLPTQVQDDAALQVLHAEILSRLREETKPTSTLDLMLIERTATQYAITKHHEETGTLIRDPRLSKEVNALLLATMERLQKASLQGQIDDIRDRLANQVLSVLDDALGNVDPNVAARVREELADSFEREGIL